LFILYLHAGTTGQPTSGHLTQTLPTNLQNPRSSVDVNVTAHRQSLADIMDGKGSILRRQSLAKLHSLTIEAPITKVINIIAAAQQNCPLYIAQALEKVLEILRTTELYSPQFFEGGSKIKSDDPLTTDLLGALLSVRESFTFSLILNIFSHRETCDFSQVLLDLGGHANLCAAESHLCFSSRLLKYQSFIFVLNVFHLQQGPRLSQGTGRRSSNENTGSRLAPRPSLPDIAEAPTSLQKLLETEERWSFDVILLEEISEKR